MRAVQSITLATVVSLSALSLAAFKPPAESSGKTPNAPATRAQPQTKPANPSSNKPDAAPPAENPAPIVPPAIPEDKSVAPELFEPKLAAGRASIKLPAEATDAQPAGAGRYLILHLKKIQSLAIVDLCQTKVAKFIQLPPGEIRYAAGLTKLFVAENQTGTLSRYDLTTFEKELTVSGPEGGIQTLVMGSGSLGPVVAGAGRKTLLYDPMTLRPEPIEWEHWAKPDDSWPAPHMIISGDGKTVVAWGGGWAGLEALTLNGQAIVDRRSGGYIHDAEAPARVTYDGSVIFTADNTFSADVKDSTLHIDGAGFAGAISANYFLAFKGEGRGGRRGETKSIELKIYMAGQDKPVWTIKGTDVADFTQSTLPPWKRIYFIPKANLLATVAGANDQVVFRRFNVIDALNQAGIDYLFVNSNPVSTAVRGINYRYNIEVQSKRGGVACALSSGPEGMTVSADGKVEWAIPEGFKDSQVKAIVSIRDSSGQEIFHPFTIQLDRQRAKPATPPKRGNTPPATKV